MASRVQVILDEAEREGFRRRAKAEGLSLSAWLRSAGREKLAARPRAARGGVKQLQALFAACDRREKGREPEWQDHLEVIARSQRSGSRRA